MASRADSASNKGSVKESGETLAERKEIRVQRGYAKSKITKCMNYVSSLMEDVKNMDTILEKLQDLDLLETAIHEICKRYMNTCDTEEERTESLSYLESVSYDLYKFKHEVMLWKERTEQKVEQIETRQVKVESLKSDRSVRSGGSNSLTGAKVQAAARLAALEAEAAAQQHLHDLEHEELALKQRKRQFQIQVEINKQKAEEKALSEFDEVASQHSHVDKFDQIEKWSSNIIPNNPQQNHDFVELVHTNQKLLQTMQLPKSEIMVFSGDPIKYYLFIKSFESVVERSLVDDSDKLTRLLQYCSGKALRAIQCCAVMDPSTGFKKAKAILKERFGQEFVICEAWINKVTTGPRIRSSDREGLLEFSDDLNNCQETLSAMNSISELMNQQNLKNIVQRLPSYLINRWCREAHKLTKQHGKVTITNVVSFVQDAAQEANNPIFGGIGNFKEKTASSKPLVPKSFTFSAQHSSPEARNENSVPKASVPRNCVMCAEQHSIFKCEKFRNLSPSDRYKLAQEKRLCHNCLIPGHFASSCLRTNTCTVPGCGKRHTRFLHPLPRRQDPEARVTPESNGQGQGVTLNAKAPSYVPNVSSSVCTGAGVGHQSSKVSLPIVPVVVKSQSGDNFIETYALLDNGSTNSFCSEALLEQLGMNSGPKQQLLLTTLDSEKTLVQSSTASFQVADMNCNNVIDMNRVYVCKKLPIDLSNVASNDEIMKYDHLNDLVLNGMSHVSNVTLLIGQDVPEALIPVEIRKGQAHEPYAVKTALGWTINGPVSAINHCKAVVNFIHASSTHVDSLENQVERLWKIDANDLLPLDGSEMSVEDKNVMKTWDDNICKSHGHYTLPIPFKNGSPNLPNNRSVASRRLELLKRRLGKDHDLHVKYRDGVNDLLIKGYAARVPDKELCRDDGHVWYLPHHPVLNPNKPNKVRIVYDCASRFQNTSLNENVLKGPDLMNNLIGVLLRFREHPIALMADVESMFHQVNVSSNDCDVLRFLWWPEGNMLLPPVDYRMNVHLFGGIWSPSCANYALRQTAQDNSTDFHPSTVKAVLRNFYMDDCLKSLETESQAMEIANELRSILLRGGFRLTKWNSNSHKVLNSIPESERAKNVKEIDLPAVPLERALGLRWSVVTDSFKIRTSVASKPATKRGVLSILSSVFDPLGFVSPFILLAKLIFQESCRLKIDWDDSLPSSLSDQWNSWLNDLPDLENFQIERCLQQYRTTDIATSELHHFSDASQSGYGVVTYLRQVDNQGKVHCSFVMSKSRLCPLKTVTIPRLELSAAALAIKVDCLLHNELDIQITESQFWTDSMLVIQYIENTTKRFNTFVANRIAAIHNGSQVNQWHYVDSNLNPADIASRGISACQLVNNELWLSGPNYLWKNIDLWPIRPNVVKSFPTEEIKKEVQIYTSVETSSTGLSDLLNHYSSWYKLKKGVAWLLRLKGLLLQKVRRRSSDAIINDIPCPSQVSVEELRYAEIEIVRYMQRQLVNDKNLANLNPIRSSDGILCVGGRLQLAPILEESKFPMILPKSHHVVDIIVRHYHILSGHSGREHVLSLLRERFWIVNGRKTVTRVINNCSHCRRRYSRPEKQMMSDLPSERVTPDQPPFTSIGVDYFGPFYVKRGRSLVKRYGCLFTCLASRAVHIEISHQLDTDSFINALQRFISRRGLPATIRSDNGTNFVGAEKELRNSLSQWNQSRIGEFLRQKNVTWKFNPPYASHMGGSWERMIRSIRKVLAALIPLQTLDDEGLSTLMCQVESILNSRPITFISSDSKDPDPLTPNHLLLLRSGPSLPPGIFVKEDIYHKRRWRQVQYLSDIFWKRWLREYLPSLQQRQKWLVPHRNVTVGDVVLLVDQNTPRNLWPLARVMEVFPGHDGLVRSARVKTRSSEFVRPIDKMCMLESV